MLARARSLRGRARRGLHRPAQKHTCTRTYVNLGIRSGAVKGSLWFPSQHGDFPIVGNTGLPTRGRARARRSVCRPAQKHTPETVLTWKPNGSPLRVPFSFQANMASFLLWAIQNSQRGRARARSQRARARGGVCVVQHRNIHQKLWQLGNPTGRR